MANYAPRTAFNLRDPRFNWDIRFLNLASHIAQWSKDPSTKVGAVIVDEHRRIVSVGYNGLPRGVSDEGTRYQDRSVKYKMIMHAEVNALMFATRPSLKGCTIYVYPFGPCAQCTGMIIQREISRVVFPNMHDEKAEKRWATDHELALVMFEEADVEVSCIQVTGSVQRCNHE